MGRRWRSNDPGSMRCAWVIISEPVMFCGYLLACQVVLLHILPPLGYSVRHPHKVDLSVGDRKSLLVKAHPRLTLGDGVWGFLTFLSRVLGGLTYNMKKPIPIISVSSAMDVSFSRMDSWSLGIEGLTGLVL